MPSIRGRLMTACGRASATTRTSAPARIRAAGRRRRMRPARDAGSSLRTAASREPSARPGGAGGARCQVRASDAERDERTASSSIGGQMNDTAYLRRRCRTPRHAGRWRGRGPRRWRASRRRRRARRNASAEGRLAARPPLRGTAGGSPRRAVSTYSCLAGLGVLEDQRADVRQLDLARVEEPDRQHLVAPVSGGPAAAPSPGR